MSCCGRRRQTYKAWMVSRPVRLRFLGEGTIQVRGNSTGKSYVFTETEREMDVDPRDARGLLQEGSITVAMNSVQKVGEWPSMSKSGVSPAPRA